MGEVGVVCVVGEVGVLCVVGLEACLQQLR